MIHYFKNLIHRIRYQSKCSFGKNVTLDSSNVFEGLNVIGNKTTVLNSQLGLATYISDNSFIKNCSIGKFSCIGPGVQTIIGRHPSSVFVSIHPIFFSTQKQCGVSFVKCSKFQENKYLDLQKRLSIIIGNDVWIGANVNILEGVTIGDGAIVATGSLIVKDVEPFTIVGGVPAKVIRQRFSDTEVNYLKNFKWWNKDYTWLKDNAALFENIDSFIAETRKEAHL